MTPVERRRGPRLTPEPDDPFRRIRLRTGHELVVLNIGCRGAIVEGPLRLLPGSCMEAHVMTASGRVLVRAEVLRCEVSFVARTQLHYRGALRFDAALDLTSWRRRSRHEPDVG